MRTKILLTIITLLFLTTNLLAQTKKKKTTVVKKATTTKVVKPTTTTTTSRTTSSSTAPVATTTRTYSEEAPAEAPKKASTTTKSTSTKSTSTKKQKASGSFQDGVVQLNAGVGASGWGTPVYVGLDFGVTEDITIGAEGSYRSFNETYYLSSYKSTIIGIGVNGNYHFGRILDIPSQWDLYAGLGLSYYIWSYGDSTYAGTNASGISLGGQLGGRYFFSDKFGVNLELGGASATTGAKIGITYRL
jgi:outer membrane immunogenic protein